MSGASWFVVSCGVRLSEVGLSEIRKPQVVRSIRIAGSKFLAHFDTAPLSNRTGRSGFCHGSIGNRFRFPRWNLILSNFGRSLPEPRNPLNCCLQVRRTQVGIPFDQGGGRMSQQRGNCTLVLAVHRQSTRKGVAEIMPSRPFNPHPGYRRPPDTVVEVPGIQRGRRILRGEDPLGPVPGIEASENGLGFYPDITDG